MRSILLCFTPFCLFVLCSPALHSQCNYWEYIGGPSGYHPIDAYATNGKLVYCLSGGKIYRSEDSGSTWSSTGLLPLAAQLVATVGDIVFTGTAGDPGQSNATFYRSLDSGRTWQEAGGDPFAHSYIEFDGSILGAGNNGLFLSDDRGATWTQIYEYPSVKMYMYELLRAGPALLAVTRESIIRSMDRGKTWSEVSRPPTITTQSGQPIDLVLNTADNRVFAFTSVGLMVSADEGATWTKTRNEGFPNQGHPWGLLLDSTFYISLFIPGSSTTPPIPASRVTLRSTDYGETWSTVATIYEPAVCVGSTILATADKGKSGPIQSQDGGSTWAVSDQGMPGTAVLSMSSLGSMLIAGTKNNGIFTSIDKGSTWQQSPASAQFTTTDRITLIGNSIFIVASTVDGSSGIYRSDDMCQSWQHIDFGVPVLQPSLLVSVDSVLLVAPAVKNQSRQRIPVLYRSIDTGRTWTAVRELPSEAFSFTHLFRSGPYVFMRMWAVPNILYRSDDRGLSWVECVKDLPFSMCFGTDGLLFASFGRGFEQSSDQGRNWEKITRPSGYQVVSLPSEHQTITSIHSSLYMIARATGLRVGGILRSIDNGKSWATINHGLPLDDSLFIPHCIYPVQSDLYIGTETGIWHYVQ